MDTATSQLVLVYCQFLSASLPVCESQGRTVVGGVAAAAVVQVGEIAPQPWGNIKVEIRVKIQERWDLYFGLGFPDEQSSLMEH